MRMGSVFSDRRLALQLAARLSAAARWAEPSALRGDKDQVANALALFFLGNQLTDCRDEIDRDIHFGV